MRSVQGQTFDAILKDWGHDVLLQRRSGDGHAQALEKHTVRHMKPSALLGLVQQERIEGIVHDVDMVYYFRPDALPREGDRIWEQDPRYPEVWVDGERFTYVSTWTIDYALPVRGKYGRVEYYAAGATRENPN